MAFTSANTISPNDVHILGFQVHFRPTGDVDWVDLGHVQNPARTVEEDEQTIQSARTGRLETVKQIVTSITKGMTFESMSSTDALILELFTGRSSDAGALGLSVPDDVTATAGEMLVLQYNAETGGKVVIDYKPNAQIRGVDEGGGDGENPATLNFEATFLIDEDYTIPEGIDAAEASAPLGFRLVVEPADVQAALDAISGAPPT